MSLLHVDTCYEDGKRERKEREREGRERKKKMISDEGKQHKFQFRSVTDITESKTVYGMVVVLHLFSEICTARGEYGKCAICNFCDGLHSPHICLLEI